MNFFNRPKTSEYETLDVQAYSSQFLENNTKHTLVDVRTSGEFNDGHAKNAINIPLHELEKRAGELPRNKPVVVICASGNRSRSGCSQLVKSGFKDVYNLKGGMFAWMTSGMATE